MRPENGSAANGRPEKGRPESRRPENGRTDIGRSDNASETYFPEYDHTKSGQTMPQSSPTECDAPESDIPAAHMSRSERMFKTRIRYARWRNIGTSKRGITTFKIGISARTTAGVGDSWTKDGLGHCL